MGQSFLGVPAHVKITRGEQRHQQVDDGLIGANAEESVSNLR